MATQFAARLSLIAFATVTTEAVISGEAFQPGVKAALTALALSYAIGLVVGDLARRVIEENAAVEFGGDGERLTSG